MRFLVTGGMGFIGHNVVRLLEQQGHECTIIDTCTDYGYISNINYLVDARSKRINSKLRKIDIRETNYIDTIMRIAKIDCVIHLASYPRQKAVEADPILAGDVMTNGLVNLLELSKKNNIKKFVYISSSMVYGDFNTDVLEAHSCQPQGQYGIMKLMGEKLVEDYHRSGYFDFVTVRPSAVYGEYDVEDRVVSKFLGAALRGEVLRVDGADQILDFTHVDDTAMGIVLAATNDRANGQVYNITRSAEQQCTLEDAAKLAISIAGQGSIELAPRNMLFPKRGRLSIMRAQRDLGYAPKVDIEKGFQRYYDWLSQNPILWRR